MIVGSSFKPGAQAAKAVKLCMSSLDYPAHLAQTAAVRLATPGNGRRNAGCMQRPTIFVVIVGAISVDPTGLAKRRAAHAANRWNRFDQRQQSRDVVAIGVAVSSFLLTKTSIQ